MLRYIKFTSHRARDYGLRALSKEGAQGYFSFTRDTGKGCYLISEAEIRVLRKESLVHFTVLRAPYDDLRMCWKG